MIVSDITNKLIQRTLDSGGKVWAFSDREKFEVESASDDKITIKSNNHVFQVGDRVSFLYEPLFKSAFIEYEDTDKDGIIDLHDLDADGDGVWDQRLPQAPKFHYVSIVFKPDAPDQVVIGISPVAPQQIVAREWGKALLIDRYYPLYITELEAFNASQCITPTASTVELNGVTYYMPGCVDQFMGDYHTCIPDAPDQLTVASVETYDFEFVDRAIAQGVFSSIVPVDYSQRVLGVDDNENGSYDTPVNYSLVKRWNVDSYIDGTGNEVISSPEYNHYQTEPQQAWNYIAHSGNRSEDVLPASHSFYLGNYVYKVNINAKYDLGSLDNEKHTQSVLKYFSHLRNGSNADFSEENAAYGIKGANFQLENFTILEVDYVNRQIITSSPILQEGESIYITSKPRPGQVNQVTAEIINPVNPPSEVVAKSDSIAEPVIIEAIVMTTPTPPSEVVGSGGVLSPSHISIKFSPFAPEYLEDKSGTVVGEPSNVVASHFPPAAPALIEEKTGLIPVAPDAAIAYNQLIGLDEIQEPAFHYECTTGFLCYFRTTDVPGSVSSQGWRLRKQWRQGDNDWGKREGERMLLEWRGNLGVSASQGKHYIYEYKGDVRYRNDDLSLVPLDAAFAPLALNEFGSDLLYFDHDAQGISGAVNDSVNMDTMREGYMGAVIKIPSFSSNGSALNTQNPILTFKNHQAYIHIFSRGTTLGARMYTSSIESYADSSNYSELRVNDRIIFYNGINYSVPDNTVGRVKYTSISDELIANPFFENYHGWKHHSIRIANDGHPGNFDKTQDGGFDDWNLPQYGFLNGDIPESIMGVDQLAKLDQNNLSYTGQNLAATREPPNGVKRFRLRAKEIIDSFPAAHPEKSICAAVTGDWSDGAFEGQEAVYEWNYQLADGGNRVGGYKRVGGDNLYLQDHRIDIDYILLKTDSNGAENLFYKTKSVGFIQLSFDGQGWPEIPTFNNAGQFLSHRTELEWYAVNTDPITDSNRTSVDWTDEVYNYSKIDARLKSRATQPPIHKQKAVNGRFSLGKYNTNQTHHGISISTDVALEPNKTYRISFDLSGFEVKDSFGIRFLWQDTDEANYGNIHWEEYDTDQYYEYFNVNDSSATITTDNNPPKQVRIWLKQGGIDLHSFSIQEVDLYNDPFVFEYDDEDGNPQEVHVDRADRGDNGWQKQEEVLGYHECTFEGVPRDTFIQIGALWAYDDPLVEKTGFLKLYIDGKRVAKINDNYKPPMVNGSSTWNGVVIPPDSLTLSPPVLKEGLHGDKKKTNELRIADDSIIAETQDANPRKYIIRQSGEFTIAEVALFDTENSNVWDDLANPANPWSTSNRTGKASGQRHAMCGVQAILASRISSSSGSGVNQVPRVRLSNLSSLNRNISSDQILQWNSIGEEIYQIHPYGGQWFDPDTCIITCDPPQPPPDCNMIDLGGGYFGQVDVIPKTQNIHIGGDKYLKKVVGYETRTTVFNSAGDRVSNPPFGVRNNIAVATNNGAGKMVSVGSVNGKDVKLDEGGYYVQGEYEKLVAIAMEEVRAEAAQARAELADYNAKYLNANPDTLDPRWEPIAYLEDDPTQIACFPPDELFCEPFDPFCGDFEFGNGYYKTTPRNPEFGVSDPGPFGSQARWWSNTRRNSRSLCL
jgi:hypothetical protein